MFRVNRGSWPATSTIRRSSRVATSSLELLVALTLLTAALTFMAPMAVRHGRVLITARHYRLALDELSNHLERLMALPADQVAAEVERLQPSPFFDARVPGIEVRGRVEPADPLTRVVLSAVWDGNSRHDASVSLAGWLLSDARPQRDEKEQENAP